MNDSERRLLSKIYNKISKEDWKNDFMRKVCMLSLEYLMLDGLSDALRGSQIPDEIILTTELLSKERK